MTVVLRAGPGSHELDQDEHEEQHHHDQEEVEHEVQASVVDQIHGGRAALAGGLHWRALWRSLSRSELGEEGGAAGQVYTILLVFRPGCSCK